MQCIIQLVSTKSAIENSISNTPKRYFGLHFAEGVAEYREPGAEPYKIFLNQDTINKMDATFEGKPVYVGHRNEVDLGTADGFVVRSFFNKSDGKNWVEFLAVSDAAQQAIVKGWKLSNAYVVKSTAPGDKWHGVEYAKEVMNAEYEHLALVPDPRYAESIILTPKQFSDYNASKELELKKLHNSNEVKKSMSLFSFFKKTKVENSADFESTIVILPKSNKEVSLTKLINDMDEMEVSLNSGMAHPKMMVNMGSEKISVEGLLSKHAECMNELDAIKKAQPVAANSEEKKDEKDSNPDKKEEAPEKAMNDGERKAFDKDGNKKEENDMGDVESQPTPITGAGLTNEEDEAKKKAEKEAEDKKQNALHFDTIKHAEATAAPQAPSTHVFNAVELGRKLYGAK